MVLFECCLVLVWVIFVIVVDVGDYVYVVFVQLCMVYCIGV